MVIASVLLIGGCAIAPVRTITRPAVENTNIIQDKSFELHGRVAVRYDGQGFSGNLRWRHDSENDDLWVLTPLGQAVAHIVRDLEGVMLTTSDQTLHRSTDAEELTQQVLGWRLPLAGLSYWVLGSNAPFTASSLDVNADGRISRLRQDDWEIEYSRYHDVGQLKLPKAITMGRPGIELRLVIDEWIRTE